MELPMFGKDEQDSKNVNVRSHASLFQPQQDTPAAEKVYIYVLYTRARGLVILNVIKSGL